MGAQRSMLSANAIDSSPIIALIEIQVLLDALWQGPRMLDHFAMHVQDIQIAIRGIGKLDWTKPMFRRSNELCFRFILGAKGGKNRPLLMESFVMNQITPTIGDPRISAVILPPGISRKKSHSRCPGEIPRRRSSAFNRPRDSASHAPPCAHHAPWFVGTDAEHGCRWTIPRNAQARWQSTNHWVRTRKKGVVDH